MNNQQLIKSAHIWFLTALLVCGLVAIAVKADSNIPSQNSNQNSNANSSTQNRNDNRSGAKMMLKDHEKDVSEFEKQSTKGTDADVKAFAGKTLPTLQEHLTMARALPGNERSGNMNSNSGGPKKPSNSNNP